MTLLCDYCDEPITTTSFQLGGAGPLAEGQIVPEIVRIDLHPECAPPFRNELKKAKGKRPVKP